MKGKAVAAAIPDISSMNIFYLKYIYSLHARNMKQQIPVVLQERDVINSTKSKEIFIMKMGIKAKLLAGFLCAASLTLIAGLVGLYSSARLGNMMSEMYNEQLVPIVYLSDVKTYVLTRSRGFYRLIIETEKKKFGKG